MEINERKIKLLKPDRSQPGVYIFGNHFTDHMFEVDYDKFLGGWQKPNIKPYGPLKISTSATGLHYGISCFEGMSVVRNSRTSVPQAFRTNDIMTSFRNSTEHLDMPTFDIEELLKCLKQLVILD